MDHRDSHCPCLQSSETTVKGTGLKVIAGKEDPVELDSSLSSEIDCLVLAKWEKEFKREIPLLIILFHSFH